MPLGGLLVYVQVFFAVAMGLYLWNFLSRRRGARAAMGRDSNRDMERLEKMRRISLTEPLSEKTRPASFEEIVGQENGLKGLRAALCGPNPQHVILYGPPGVGKTAAARLVLDEAKGNSLSPFCHEAKFVEIDATTARFDERGIADPLIGSVHDPIYQGAGPLGVAGVPQPKPGAVTRAHGGILFIDEIGELHPHQMNKLLKVLEDRKVFLESAYYNPDDKNIPPHVKDIFENGLPADFRLVGATTRTPDDLPPAIRSRCVEVFFRPLLPDEVTEVARNAARRISFDVDPGALEVISAHASNGRDAVNMVQIGAGIVLSRGEGRLDRKTLEWVVDSGHYNRRVDWRPSQEAAVGVVNGLAVAGNHLGTILEIEASAYRSGQDGGSITLTGLIEEEEIQARGGAVRRKSMARASVENVLTVLRAHADLDPRQMDIHVNFPGGIPVDGPSAGVATAVAIYSALTGQTVKSGVAMTGEISIRGLIRPVGGVSLKVEAARRAGITRVLVPEENYQESWSETEGMEVIPVGTFDQVLDLAIETARSVGT